MEQTTSTCHCSIVRTALKEMSKYTYYSQTFPHTLACTLTLKVRRPILTASYCVKVSCKAYHKISAKGPHAKVRMLLIDMNYFFISNHLSGLEAWVPTLLLMIPSNLSDVCNQENTKYIETWYNSVNSALASEVVSAHALFPFIMNTY